ncbi:taste receptor type 2 member 4-like [Pseudophryne corroboree]|uniref:taste receptor type 2 member 4-like n=1 Tax=Pseudophryne corroboree TaxID=495146 RepID=UPI0030815BAA
MNYGFFIFSLPVTWLLMSIGLLLNIYIVAQNFIWRVKGHSLQTIDILMTSLGLVRILFLISYVPVISSITAVIPIPVNIYQYYDTAVACVMFCSLWWGTVLCVFYCVKITNYSNRLFLRLKMNISRMVPWLLLTSLLVSILCSLPCRWAVFSIHYMNSTQLTNDTNDGNVAININYTNVVITYLAGSIIPFLIFCAAVSLLIASLLKHTRNMSSNNSGFTKSQLDAHKRTIINMTSFLFFYILFLIGINLMPFAFQVENTSYRFLCSILCISYPALHSIMLIANNGNLKRAINAVFRCARKWPHV